MNYEKKTLFYTDKAEIVTVDGEYLCTISMTDRGKELLDNVGWEKGKESWFSYRGRTKQERINEELKRVEIAKDLVMAYNEKYDFL